MRPYTLIAELTYRCPLACVYCSNPIDFPRHADELDTATWERVFAEAEQLGVVQVCFTGGEPLVRHDLPGLIARASALDLYTNLITSGIPLTRDRLVELRRAGLRNVQLSLQDSDETNADRIAGLRCHAEKLRVAELVKRADLPLTINCVLHQINIDNIEAIIALAERFAPDRIELANTQYLGWALRNRSALLPSRAQIERARDVAAAARERLRGRAEVVFVTPDYFAEYPPPCMDGWGRRFIVISPDGLVLPCHAAHSLPGRTFENFRDAPLEEIWTRSAGFNAFRGEEWMPEPCRSCDRRGIDFGGCRCHAYHVVGDAAATDPVCVRSPHHDIVTTALPAAGPLRHRTPRQ